MYILHRLGKQVFLRILYMVYQLAKITYHKKTKLSTVDIKNKNILLEPVRLYK